MAKGDLFMKHKLTAQELCNFCQQLGVLIHSGMGPLESLHILLKKVRPTQTVKFFPIYCLPWKKQGLYLRLSQIRDFFLILWLLT